MSRHFAVPEERECWSGTSPSALIVLKFHLEGRSAGVIPQVGIGQRVTGSHADGGAVPIFRNRTRVVAPTAAGPPSAASSPGPRLTGGVSIRSKVVMLTLIPLVAMLVFACLLTFSSVQEAESSQRIRELATLGNRTAILVGDLQVERSAAAGYVADPGTVPTAPTLREFVARGNATDGALRDFMASSEDLDSVAVAPISAELDRVSQGSGVLQRNRTKVLEEARTTGVRVSTATSIYAQLIKDLLAMKERLASAANGDQNLSDQLIAASAFTRYKEAIAEEQVAVEIALHDGLGHFTNDTLNDYRSAVSDQNAFENQFLISATGEQRTTRDGTLTRELPYQRLSTRAQSAGLDKHLSFDLAAWTATSATENRLLQSVEKRLDGSAVQTAGAYRDSAIRKAGVLSGLALVSLVVALSASVLVGRSMVRSLVRLRASAFEVAYQSLPAVVRRLENTNAKIEPGLDEEGAAPAMLRALEIQSRDEIGQVAQAFNAVHLEAVRVASEQAQLRQSVSTMFANLSRRSQVLVDRLISLIDGLEQGERDPDRLSELFKLDHLATRMRRNDENLLVLAGADAARRWRHPAPLVDVLRAATAEVEQYTRIVLGSVDGSVEISASAVNDLVHLIAEILENATSYSAPRTKVNIDARRHGDQVSVEVMDQGIGMSRVRLAELNERLARPPVFDIAVARMMGLFVVGRLASRHGVTVTLRGASSGGVLAIITLPSTVLHSDQAAPVTMPASGGFVGSPPTQRVPSEEPTQLLSHPTVFSPPSVEAGSPYQNGLSLATLPRQLRELEAPAERTVADRSATDRTTPTPLPAFEAIESDWFRSPPTLDGKPEEPEEM